MYKLGIMLGYHVTKHKSYVDSIAQSEEHLANSGVTSMCHQVFFSGPLSSKPTITHEEAMKLRGKNIFVHGAYIDYMNGSATSTNNIIQELELADSANAQGLVLHLGRNMDVIANMDNFMDGSQTPIYLEINAQKAPNWSSPLALSELFADLSETDYYQRCKLCIDTQHMFACGVSFSTRESWQEWKKELKETFNNVGLELPSLMFHLNDSHNAAHFGEGKDRHAEITDGLIWSNYSPNVAKKLHVLPREHFYKSGCCAILDYSKKHNLPIILESKKPTVALDLLKLLWI